MNNAVSNYAKACASGSYGGMVAGGGGAFPGAIIGTAAGGLAGCAQGMYDYYSDFNHECGCHQSDMPSEGRDR